MPYPVINTLSDGGYPRGAFNYWKSAFLSELSDASLEIMVDAMHRCPSPMSGLGIVPYLGAVARVDTAATAFGHRAIACSSSRNGRASGKSGRTSPGPERRSRHSAPT